MYKFLAIIILALLLGACARNDIRGYGKNDVEKVAVKLDKGWVEFKSQTHKALTDSIFNVFTKIVKYKSQDEIPPRSTSKHIYINFYFKDGEVEEFMIGTDKETGTHTLTYLNDYHPASKEYKELDFNYLLKLILSKSSDS